MTSPAKHLFPIDQDYLLKTLEKLLNIPSPTGFTDTISRYVTKELEAFGLSVELTRRGAIRAVLPAEESRSARAIVSHLDTLGAQVRYIKDNGRLGLAPIGHWSARFAEGARTTIFTEDSIYRGTILPLKASGHSFNEEIDTQPVGWEHIELRIDEITESRGETEALGIEVGDTITIDPQPEFLDNGFIVSRHLDNKAGVATTLAALKSMKETGAKPPVDLYWLFTIAEEVGVGASSILTPEVASMLTVDNGTTAPGQNSREFGVTISMGDQTGPFDYHLTKKLKHLCLEHGISYQKDIFRYYRSDSASALEAGADVRTALITFGVDASHGYERIHYDALESVARLICAYAVSPVEIARDMEETSDLEGFTRQPVPPAS